MPWREVHHPAFAAAAKPWLRTLLAFVLVVLAVSMPNLVRQPVNVPAPVSAPSTTSSLPIPAVAERLDWAMARFEAAGLDLPPVQVSFHSDLYACAGHRGLLRGFSDIALIDVCDPTRHVILHELAHAWLAYTIGSSTKAAVLEYWELETWSNSSVPWTDRGSEKAATALAFSLGNLPSDPSPSLLRYLCSYELITGRPFPQADVDARCD